MLTAWFIVVLAAALLAFCFFLAEELDLRRQNPLILPPWTPVFLPLIILAASIMLYSVFVCFRAYRTRPVEPKSVNNDDDNPVPKPKVNRSYIDAVVDFLVSLKLLVFIFTLIVALNRSDIPALANRWAAFAFTELVFILVVAFFGWLTLLGAVRTYIHYRELADDESCIASLMSYCTPRITPPTVTPEDPPARATINGYQQYLARHTYQNNKLVYIFSLGLLPNRWIDGFHIGLLLLHLVAIFVSGLLVFSRLRQISEIDAELMIADAQRIAALQFSTSTALSTSSDSTAMTTAMMEPFRRIMYHVLHSLQDWRGRVIPLAVVFIPLFITQGFLLLFALPQALFYIYQRRPIVHWIHGTVYVVFLAMVILFEALLSARVDDGVLDQTSWHGTFAPLYTTLLFTIVMMFPVAACTTARYQSKSRWGVYVEP